MDFFDWVGRLFWGLLSWLWEILFFPFSSWSGPRTLRGLLELLLWLLGLAVVGVLLWKFWLSPYFAPTPTRP